MQTANSRNLNEPDNSRISPASDRRHSHSHSAVETSLERLPDARTTATTAQVHVGSALISRDAPVEDPPLNNFTSVDVSLQQTLRGSTAPNTPHSPAPSTLTECSSAIEENVAPPSAPEDPRFAPRNEQILHAQTTTENQQVLPSLSMCCD
jgi:hypothetical protein